MVQCPVSTLFKMKKNLIIQIVIFFSMTTSAQIISTPDKIYGQLFTDVQLAKIFPDGKTFVDCVPKRSPKQIVADYLKIKNNPAIRFSLKRFVEENFELPEAPQLNYVTKETDVKEHINNLWNVLKREKDKAVTGSSLLPLPNSYIVPGGRFHEIYYWDSYFTMLGLKESKEYDLIENMVKNFAYLINTFGHVPNGNRSYYLTRSQPPYFSLMVKLLADIKGEQVYKEFLPALQKEYDYWMLGASTVKPGQAFKSVVKLKDGTILNRYWDESTTARQESYRDDIETADEAVKHMLASTTFADGKKAEAAAKKLRLKLYRDLRAGAASGWDFSSRWLADGQHLSRIQTTDILPIDLNCLLLNLERTLEEAYRISGKENLRKKYNTLAYKREQSFRNVFSCAELHYYSDYNFITKKSTGIAAASSVMIVSYLTEPNPEGMIGHGNSTAAFIRKYLLKEGGILSTAVSTTQQWDAPNGWAPLQWIAVTALERTGQKELAKEIAMRWIKLNKEVFARTGKLMEKYNVVDTHLEAGGGEYAGQDGFGWTNGVLLALMNKYKIN